MIRERQALIIVRFWYYADPAFFKFLEITVTLHVIWRGSFIYMCQCFHSQSRNWMNGKLSHSRTKPTKWPLRQAKFQISWVSPQSDQSSLSAWRKFGSLATHKVQQEDWSDWMDAQTDQSSLGAHHFVDCCVLAQMSHDMTKPTRWVCAQWRLRSAWASTQSDQSLCCPHEESLGP